MTRDEAEDLVMDLIQAYRDYENTPHRKYYREDYYNLREKVVVALVQHSPQDTSHD